jgi:hypothetical protein
MLKLTEENLASLMSTRGVDVIGVGQRTIAYTVIADGGTGQIIITAAGHGLKKHQSFWITSGGAYANTAHKVKKVIDANTFIADGTFGVTAAGNINLIVALDCEGFIVNVATGLVFSELVPDDPNIDAATLIAKTYAVGEVVPIPCSKIRITAVGQITCIRKQPQTDLPYSRR